MKKTSILNSFRKLLRNSFTEKLLYISIKNKVLSYFFLKVIPSHYLYEPNSIRNVKREGINFSLDISDYQNWLIYFGVKNDFPIGFFELIKPNSTIIDIGTNIGQTALHCAKLAGKNSKIIGFEPDKINYEKALKNIQLNSFKNITLFNFALGKQKEGVPLKINSPKNRGGNRVDRKLIDSKNIIQVEILDDIIHKLNIDTVSIIKIDVEGFEMEVLNGAQQTIQKQKPILFIEIDDRNLKEQNTSAEELIQFLFKMNYSIKIAATNDKILNVNNFLNCSVDIIAEPNKVSIEN